VSATSVFCMMEAITLTDAALDLLKRNMSGPQIRVDDENREAYRELSRAGLMYPLHTFAHGDEGSYRLTMDGADFGRGLVGME
jgi:hypothetical protein